MSTGNVIPLDRSGSIEQPTFKSFYKLLNKGYWCHIFAEGKVKQNWLVLLYSYYFYLFIFGCYFSNNRQNLFIILLLLLFIYHSTRLFIILLLLKFIYHSTRAI